MLSVVTFPYHIRGPMSVLMLRGEGRNFIFLLPKLLAKLLQRQGQAAQSVIRTLSQPRAPQCRTGTSKIDFTLLPNVLPQAGLLMGEHI